MTNQEAFDKAARHLLAQGCKSINGWAYCLYRGPNGTKCAIGALIPDEEYLPDMEGFTADESSIIYDTPSLAGTDPRFLRVLQIVHDEYEPEAWPRELARVASKFGLNASVLKN